MDNGTLALIATPISVVITTLITQFVMRRNAKDTTDIDRFQANLNAYAARATVAESKVAALEEKDSEKESRINRLEEQYAAQARQITRIRTIVQDWFKELKRVWPLSTPMPTPSEDDLELLGITQQKRKAVK